MTLEGDSTLPTRFTSARSPLYATPETDRAPLRVVLVAPLEVPAWLASFLRFAAENAWIEVSVVLARVDPARAERPHLPLDLWAYLALERLRRHGDDGMLALVDIAERARSTRSALIASDDELRDLRAQIAALEPELLLLLGDRELSEALADCAERGCWRVGTELSDPLTAALALLPPLLNEELATRIELRLGFESEATSIQLASGNSATRSGSFGLQREQALRKLPMLLLRSLRELHEGRLQLPSRRAACLRLQEAATSFAFGSGIRAFAISTRNTVRWWRRLWHGEDPWFLALPSAQAPLDPDAPKIAAVSALVAPQGRYWADPCLVDDAGRRLLFVEEYGYRDSKGVIVCLALHTDGSAERLGIALDEPHHLSYPQAFRWNGAWYMTAEAGAARRAWLYRASSFPLFWEPVAELLGGCLCVDPTLHHHDDGHWYLFAGVSESGAGNTCDELFLFVSDSLTGPYRPHPANPIVRDVRGARPAGRLFPHNGRLIRPAQDCTPDYGAAIVFNEVLELSPTRYRERALSHLDSSWMPGLWGCHTYSAAAGAEVVDARGHPAPGTACVDVIDTALAVHGLADFVPVVSVLVPVYNGERYLAHALDSALAQTLREIEILVVDDGSKDASGAIADRYAAEFPDRIRVIHQANQGLPLARNAAIAVARGRYFALLDADDVWLPGHLAACVDVLERDPMIGLAHANAEDIDAEGRRIAYAEEPPRWGAEERDPYAAVLLRRQHIVCPTVVFRRSVVESVGAFDAAFNRLGCEDRDLWLRIAEVANIAYIDELQAQYRIHGSNMSANSDRMWRARRLLVDKYAQRPRGRPLRRRALAAIDADLGHELALAEAARPALAAFARALVRDPLRVDAWKGLIRRILIGRRPGLIVPR